MNPDRHISGAMRFIVVLCSGLVTTALALAGVYVSSRGGSIMTYYVAFVIPAGPVLVGSVAASGYGVASLWMGFKLRRTLILSILVAMLLSYFGANYIEYRLRYPNGVSDGEGHLMSFFSYFDYMTRAFHFRRHNGDAQSLGWFGYAFRALEMSGFLAPGWFAAEYFLRGRLYCEACRRYLRSEAIAVLAPDAERPLAAILEAVGDGRALSHAVVIHSPRPTWDTLSRSGDRRVVRLCHCADCHSGFVNVEVLAGDATQREGRVLETRRIDSKAVIDFLRLRQ